MDGQSTREQETLKTDSWRRGLPSERQSPRRLERRIAIRLEPGKVACGSAPLAQSGRKSACRMLCSRSHVGSPTHRSRQSPASKWGNGASSGAIARETEQTNLVMTASLSLRAVTQ